MDLAIRCRDLYKTYPGKPAVEAVRGLDLEVFPGECFGLLGPNGAGKTTTVEILEGLLDPTAGEVEILGLRWGRDDRQLRQRLGVSLQETKLAGKITVAETLALFGSFYLLPRPVDELLDEVGLQEKRSAYVVNLSGGQRQRLAVASALVASPDLLFLDEPTTGLDPQSRRQLWDIIRNHGLKGRTTLLTTHYMDEAERLCDRVAIVDHGKVIALGTPAELIASLGAENMIEFGVADNPTPLREETLLRLPSVRAARREAGNWQLTAAEPHLALPALLALLEAEGRELQLLTTRHASLEDVFVALTGRHLRDE